MKRFLLTMIMVVIGLSAFSQSPSRLICLQPTYPLVVGENSIDGVTFSNNGIYLDDIELDSLPKYEIGIIGIQSVRYSDNGYGFYVKADSLHSTNIVYSYEVTGQPQGEFKFNETTGCFKYYPSADEYKSFIVTFSATNGLESISEEVEFRMMPKTPSEIDIFYSKGIMPDASDYITYAETTKPMYLNNEDRTAYSISISGKDVVFDDAIHNKVWGLSGREDIYELNIYAERLIVRSALYFPQTQITIYAKEIVFEDKGKNFAAINTTPKSMETLTNGNGAKGADAGDIRLYVKEFKGNMGLRFVLNGATGQSTNRNGTPGNGGNGGTLYSTLDLTNYCDFARGSGGLKYDVAEDGSTNAGPVIGYGVIGRNGGYKQNGGSYLHPYYIAAVVRHANDAFINNFVEYTIQTCKEYYALIDEYLNSSSASENGDVNEGVIDDWENVLGSRSASIKSIDGLIDEGDVINSKLEFQNVLLEINKMLFKLEQGLDFFGNPVGWVPLLSFEVYLKNYDIEIDRAIPTLYMYYWLNRVDRTLQNKVGASQEAASQTKKEIDSNIELMNSLVLEVPVLQDEADALSALIEELTNRIENLQNQLMAQAIKNVKRKNWLQKLFSIGKAVVNVVSKVPVLGLIGSGLDLALNVASTSINYTTGVDFSSAMKEIDTEEMINNYNEMKQNLTDAQNKVNQKDYAGLLSACSSLFDNGKSLANSINNAYNVLSRNTAPNSEVEAEYNRLIANSPEWQSLKSQIDELNVRKTELLNHMNEVFANMTTTVSELNNDALALDAFKRDAFTGNSKRDLNAMLYLEKLEQRAKNRLLKYDYYLRKAYEYRLLKPYEGEEFNLGGMFERLETLGLALDSVVDVSAYNTLSSVYRERVSDMTYKIIEEYTYNQPEKSTNVPIVISKEQLETINANGSTTLNLYEQDYCFNFFQDEENIRIMNLGVKYIKAHAVGGATKSRLALEMRHSGISQYRKGGQIYCFDHISRNNDNPHKWRTTIDFNDFAEKVYPETHQNSVAISSLLSSILNNNNESIMLFSRPSVWSNITLSKVVQTNGDDIVIDSLVLELQYDYTLRPDNIRNIDVTANNGLKPYIACSVEDISGKSSGRGPLYRSYRTSNQSVTFTAQDKYETYYFMNWTNRNGKVVSNKPELTISRSQDQYYIANYERRVPIMDVADTIKVGNSGGTYTVNVFNIGSGDTEMDWYVSDSLSTWIHVNGVDEGVDDGLFMFTCSENTTGIERIDSLEIFAPECDVMSKIIYIVQSDKDIYNILRGDVNGDGVVNGTDIQAIINLIVEGQFDEKADVNEDGNVNGTDIQEVINIIVNAQ